MARAESMKLTKKQSVFLGILLGLSILLCPSSLRAASFDCAKAKTPVEKMICADAELSKLDEEMAAAYQRELARTDDKEGLKKDQLDWLRRRNDAYGCFSNDGKRLTDCVKDSYLESLFYLRPDGFNIIYSQDDKICGQFAGILNDDLKRHGNIDPSRHKEFNFADFKQIQRMTSNRRRDIFISYFDINNDGTDEAVFKWDLYHHDVIMPDIVYTTKEDGIAIEKSIIQDSQGKSDHKYESDYKFFSGKEFCDKILGKGRMATGEMGTIGINSGFGVFSFSDTTGKFLYDSHKNSYVRAFGGGIVEPDPYPVLINGKHFIAVFGVIEGWLPYTCMYKCTTLNTGNIVALVAYDSSNLRDELCILTRANKITRRLIFNQQGGTKWP
jgi:uncharacterized protein YecT (DUF1311 family)